MGERYVYRGSLTTPPYTEPILWNVLPTIVSIRKETLAYFGNNKRLVGEYNEPGEYIKFGGSNRAKKPAFGREIIKVDIPYWQSNSIESDPVAYFTQERDENLYAQKIDLLKTYLTQM